MEKTNMLWGFLKEYLEYNNTCVVSDNQVNISFQEMLNMTKTLGGNLREIIFTKAKCVILCEKNFNTALSILGCWNANLIPIPLSKNYGEDHCSKIIEIVKPDIIITDNINNKLLNGFEFPLFSIKENKLYGNISNSKYEKILENIALIMFTSGTTGKPKGAMITEEGLITNIKDIGRYFKIDSNDKILIARPIYHCAVLTGEFLTSIYKGVNIHFFDHTYNPASIISAIIDNNITVMCGTPTLFSHIVLHAKRKDININLKSMVISGECMISEIAKDIRGVFKNTDIYNVYGLTEASPRVSFLEPRLFDEYPESVGIPLQSVSVKIVDDKGKEVAPNIHGHLIVKGKSIMKGYYNNIESKVVKNEWLSTGDIAFKNEGGLIFIKARADDMIIKGGMNIYPKEIENVLKQEESIENVLAYGIKSKLGSRIGLKIVLSDKFTELTTGEIMNICSRVLPNYQLPSKIEIVKEIERNASGKIVRPKLPI
jgi:acyl-CoA synthetase (AMP-forming)/AMP-acid ligase II